MSSRNLTVGLVGPGAIGRTHAAVVGQIDGLELTAIAGGERDRVVAEFGHQISHFDDVETMLSQSRPDIVVITTPSGDHYLPARAALRAGCHVLCEKPLTVDAGEAARLVALAEEKGCVAATISQRRFEPVHQYISRLLASGRLGKLRLIEADVHWWRSDAYYVEKPWRGSLEQGGGSLANQGVHSLDLMLFFAGRVASVAAMTSTVGHAIGVEDLAGALLAFESGAMGVLVTSTATPPGNAAGLRLFTDRGNCAIEQEDVTLWNFEGIPKPPAASGAGSGASDPGAIGLAGHITQWTDFRDAIRAKRAPAIGFTDGAAAARVVAAIYRAAAEQRHVSLAEFPEKLPDMGA